MENLLKREAVIEAARGKYRTNFIIWSDKYGTYCEENAENMLMPLMDRLLSALQNIAAEAATIPFYKAGKNETDLFYLYGVLAFSYASKHYCQLPYPPFRKKYDGNGWCYVGNMETGKHPRTGIGTQQNLNLGSRGSCSHTTYNSISGITFRQMMSDQYLNVCEDLLCRGKTEDIESAAGAIQEGYLVKKTDGSFFVTVPFFTKQQKEAFDAIADRYLAPLMPAYSEAVNRFIAGYKKLFPKHLHDDADRMCHNMFLGLYAAVIEYAQKTTAIPMPSPGCFCDIMIQLKKS